MGKKKFLELISLAAQPLPKGAEKSFREYLSALILENEAPDY